MILKGKVAMVTGASKGLGKAMAVGLSKQGADIIAVGIGDFSETEKEILSLNQKFLGIKKNLMDTEEIPKLSQIVEMGISHFGKIDILVNNAGITPKGLAEDYSLEALDDVFNLNVKALFHLTQEVGKTMIQNNYGKIINIASIQSIIGGVNVSGYVASKHAVSGITKSFANEWGKYNINVNAIAPGFMVTDNTEELRGMTDLTNDITKRIPLNRWGKPEDLQGAVVFLASDASSYVNGHVLVIDGGYINN